MASALINCPAPAKLNLFLHVVGRRADGYHLLQSVFQLIDLCDWLDFYPRSDGRIRLQSDFDGVAEQDNLVCRAARALQAHSGTTQGADIVLRKSIPAGAGLGGGSSDAATTLMALNVLWQCRCPAAELAALGQALGADVPFFLFGHNAFAEGIGEQLHALEISGAHYVVLFPRVAVSTVCVFTDSGLTKETEQVTIADFVKGSKSGALFGHNDLQAVTCRLYPQVMSALQWLEGFLPARMSGSGSAVFAAVADEQQGQAIVDACPACWSAWKVDALAIHPLHQRFASFA